MPSSACRVCDDTGPHPSFTARERMFGLGGDFAYFRCGACGCLQIEAFPGDMSPYYPADYHSLTADPRAAYAGWRGAVRTARDRWLVLGTGTVGRVVAALRDEPALASLGLLELRPGTRLLDVGSGTGSHLYALQRLGFTHLRGIDPFLARDLCYPPSLRIERKSLHEIEGEEPWDVITFHHVFEHTPDPLEQLAKAFALLVPGGVCLVRVPVSDSEAWERYGTRWVQLDAPRHFFLHTRESMEVAARRTGFVLERVAHDSTAFQFWGSELYRRDLPLHGGEAPAEVRAARLLGRLAMRRFRHRAARLNREGRGDQAIFILRSPTSKHL